MMRCCGSIATASRPEMPKKSASKNSTPSMKPPHLLTALFFAWLSLE
nr:hypothetical protein [Massilia sp. erpn]